MTVSGGAFVPVPGLGEMSVFGLVGMVGVVLYLCNYTLLQLGYVRGSGYAYPLMVIAAAGCVLLSLVEEFNRSALMIQCSFICISAVGLVRRFVIGRRLRFSESDSMFARFLQPGLTSGEVRMLLDRGHWTELPSGTVLTREGERIDHLIFIARGSAAVFRHGVRVATIEPGQFVGEMTYHCDSPATATVVVDRAAHCLRLPVGRLRRHLQANPVVRDRLERCVAADLRQKLNTSAALVVELHGGRPAEPPAAAETRASTSAEA